MSVVVLWRAVADMLVVMETSLEVRGMVLVALSIAVADISSKGKSQCMMFDMVGTPSRVVATNLSSFVTSSLFLLLEPVVH